MINNPAKKRKTERPYRYIHIGYPKSASTALQKAYFGKHNQLLHLGCGNPVKKNYWDDHGYIDENVNSAIEIDLRYKTNFAYDQTKTKEVFDKYFQIADNNKYIHAVGVSNENFSFNWHGGIDIVEKAKRLKYIFGAEAQIIIVVRNQKSLIESLYKESIRFGYSGSFHDYLKYLWSFKDRNFTYEFCFEKVVKLYSELFGSNNVHILFFEDLKTNKETFLKDLSTAIGIDYYPLSFSEEFNKQLDNKELSIKRSLNKKYPHTLEKGKYEVVDTHRFIPYYTTELESEVDNEVYIDYLTRKHFNKLSKELKDKIKVDEILIDWDTVYGEKIIKLYNESNKELSDQRIGLREKLEKYRYYNIKK